MHKIKDRIINLTVTESTLWAFGWKASYCGLLQASSPLDRVVSINPDADYFTAFEDNIVTDTSIRSSKNKFKYKIPKGSKYYTAICFGSKHYAVLDNLLLDLDSGATHPHGKIDVRCHAYAAADNEVLLMSREGDRSARLWRVSNPTRPTVDGMLTIEGLDGIQRARPIGHIGQIVYAIIGQHIHGDGRSSLACINLKDGSYRDLNIDMTGRGLVLANVVKGAFWLNLSDDKTESSAVVELRRNGTMQQKAVIPGKVMTSCAVGGEFCAITARPDGAIVAMVIDGAMDRVRQIPFEGIRCQGTPFAAWGGSNLVVIHSEGVAVYEPIF